MKNGAPERKATLHARRQRFGFCARLIGQADPAEDLLGPRLGKAVQAAMEQQIPQARTAAVQAIFEVERPDFQAQLCPI